MSSGERDEKKRRETGGRVEQRPAATEVAI